MRIHNSKWNIVGRKLTVLLLLCGLLLPSVLSASAASVTYEYTRINSTAGLPTDNQWHDYFIAWEYYDEYLDIYSDAIVYFTDYHYYNADGNSNIDVGGSHYMKYLAASTLPKPYDTSFASDRKLGHMQIKYAGMDSDNSSPMYYIRVSKMNGGYMYFTEYEPTSAQTDAEAFTFENHGDDFHIFVNISGKADRYLTRNGKYLETTESSSYGGGDDYRPMRVYKQNHIINDDGNKDNVIGKITLYEYSWVNTADELLKLANNSKTWTDIMLAWEDADGSGTSNPDKVWYAKETWYDSENKPNYEDTTLDWFYYSNDTLGSDGYSSPYAESFILPYKASNFQVIFNNWDTANPIDGYVDANSKQQASPAFRYRFHVIQNKYMYIDGSNLAETDSWIGYTTQLRLDEDNDEDIYGSMHIFENISGPDYYFTRKKNRIDGSNYSISKYWEFPFRIYTCKALEYDAIVKSFTIGKGATYSIESQLIVNEGVTITVEDGGILTINDGLLNNGKIIVKNGGTVVLNENAYLMAYNLKTEGTLSLDGGNLVIMDGAKVICDHNGGTLQMDHASTILNRGLLLVGKSLVMNHNSVLKNESTGMLVLGGNITRERGGIAVSSFDDIVSCLQQFRCTKLISDNSKIVNNGRLVEPEMKENIDTNIPTVRPGGDGSNRR